MCSRTATALTVKNHPELNIRSAPCAAVVSTQFSTDSEMDCLRVAAGAGVVGVVVAVADGKVAADIVCAGAIVAGEATTGEASM